MKPWLSVVREALPCDTCIYSAWVELQSIAVVPEADPSQGEEEKSGHMPTSSCPHGINCVWVIND